MFWAAPQPPLFGLLVLIAKHWLLKELPMSKFPFSDVKRWNMEHRGIIVNSKYCITVQCLQVAFAEDDLCQLACKAKSYDEGFFLPNVLAWWHPIWEVIVHSQKLDIGWARSHKEKRGLRDHVTIGGNSDKSGCVIMLRFYKVLDDLDPAAITISLWMASYAMMMSSTCVYTVVRV